MKLCPFKKEVTQEQTMPSSLSTPEPPRILITEEFAECDEEKCMAYQGGVDHNYCKLCEKSS